MKSVHSPHSSVSAPSSQSGLPGNLTCSAVHFRSALYVANAQKKYGDMVRILASTRTCSTKKSKESRPHPITPPLSPQPSTSSTRIRLAKSDDSGSSPEDGGERQEVHRLITSCEKLV